MRIRVAIIVGLAVAGFVISGRLLNNRTPAPARLAELRTACPDCHGEVPEYRAAAQVHGRHAAFDCSRCHGGGGGLKTTDRLHGGLETLLIGLSLLVLAVLGANHLVISGKARPAGAAEARSIRRFYGGARLVHWLHAASFAVLLVTGTLMFFDLTDMDGGRLIRTIHLAGAAAFSAVPVLFLLADPKAALGFLKQAFAWGRDDLAWLRSAAGFYFGRGTETARQGYLNGDQRLWQFVTALTGMTATLTGLLLGFFKLKMSPGLYQVVLLTHAVSFVLAAVLFLAHFYLAVMHPRFEESLSAMVDGKVSPEFARERYGKWYESLAGEEDGPISGPDPPPARPSAGTAAVGASQGPARGRRPDG